MATNNKQQYEEHSFKSFLEKYKVIIPMVQRDYAQGRETDSVRRVRGRFLTSIKDHLNSGIPMELDFIYGETGPINSETEKKITPLDGQQRLTTLYLLHWFAAKKCGVADYSFLNNFTYDIRPSARDFCTHLMKYTPDWSKSFDFQLKDEEWFMGEWIYDPTVIGMIVMLDAIKEKFSDIPNLWDLLTGYTIKFYFLPLSENGLSDELYIKMNSRGKNLTAFEHFKAEYEDLYKEDTGLSSKINHKLDVEWADIFFPYRDKGKSSKNITDDEFMRYFFYISHILCYKQGIKRSNDEFELIKTLYKEPKKDKENCEGNPRATENREYFEKALDCWYNVKHEYNSIDKFFETYLSHSSYRENYDKDKVATFKSLDEFKGINKDKVGQNFFCACIKLYQVNNNFSLGDFLFLYGIITYLINKERIKETDFRIRLRMLRNLIWNSNSGEIRIEYMQDLINEVEILILRGEICKTNHGFNGKQEKEELDKQQRAESIDIENLHKFEDHPLIYGFASGMGYNNLDLVATFMKEFNPDNVDYLKIHQAMIAIGDYRQNDSRRYYLGNANRSTWENLFHESQSRKNFDETMNALRTLLNRRQANESLDDIINSYISQKESEKRYDWRYYFAKYPTMLRGADGEFVWDKNEEKIDHYSCTALNKHQFNGQHWNPYLNVIYQTLAEEMKERYGRDILQLENYGNDLNIIPTSSTLKATASGFEYICNGQTEVWAVSQEDEIDIEDRITMAINKLNEKVESCLQD